jgi:epoxide hydrolase-like predicted phosphatase
MEIKAIFFDLGNVLLALDWKKIFSRILQRSALSSEELGKRFVQTRYVQYELNQITTDEFFTDFKRVLEFQGSKEELQEITTHIVSPIDNHIALAKRLKACYRLGIISNTNQAHADFFEARYDFLDLFEVRIYSHEARARKPDRKIYDLALSSMKAIASQSLFIDDLKENVDAARDLGWRAIHLKKDTDLEHELRAFGVLP